MANRKNLIFASKDDANFQEALKLYEGKHYKKALKIIDQTLKKNSSHPESLALKGCIQYFTGHKDEAESYILRALKKSSQSYLVGHLAGIYYRSTENYPEAAKWLKASLENGAPNKHLWRDLSVLQTQIRDYKNLKDSKQQYLEAQPGYRANWTGVAVALHLNKNYNGAVSTLAKIEEIIKEHLQEGDLYEHSESILYKVDIIGDSGDYERALEELEKGKDDIRDKKSYLEYKAKFLLQCDRNAEASTIYRQLLQRNPDNKDYYHQLEVSLGSDKLSSRERLNLYDKLCKFYPRSDPPKIIPLSFLPASEPEFKEKAAKYIVEQLKRGVPATFVNVKPLYKSRGKIEIIEQIVKQFEESEDTTTNPPVFVWTKYFLAQHYLYLNDLDQAMREVNSALDHSPTLVEPYLLKARILKHQGKINDASDIMEEGRSLDLQDRFVNSKCTKYLLRANKVDEAIECISLFCKLDKEAVNGCKDLHLMQVNWVLIESAEAYYRLYKECQSKLSSIEFSELEADEKESIIADLTEKIFNYEGLALKRFCAIDKIFDIFKNDQFDFHTYCLRRGTPRDYIETLEWEDKVHSSPIYMRMARGLGKLCFEIYDEKKKKDTAIDDNKSKKSRKNKKNKTHAKKLEELIARVSSEKDDKDPLGRNLLDSFLLSKDEPLEFFSSIVKNLLNEAKESKITWSLSYELHLRQGKYVLALQAIRNMTKLVGSLEEANSDIPSMAQRLHDAVKNDNTANVAIAKVVEKGLSESYSSYIDVSK